MNTPEILEFSFKEISISRKLIKSRAELITYIKFLSKKYKYPINKIVFNHDSEDNNFEKHKFWFMDNFKLKGSYDYLKEELK